MLPNEEIGRITAANKEFCVVILNGVKDLTYTRLAALICTRVQSFDCEVPRFARDDNT
jgi:hypothetical protein